MLKYKKYYSTQALDEGFKPKQDGEKIFYRTSDWVEYKKFKGHSEGYVSPEQSKRYDRHSIEVSKCLSRQDKIISLGGGDWTA
jgi:hypothetical protein